MATLEQIEDALRGSVSEGNLDNQQKLSDAMRAHPTFQSNAKLALDNEDYKYANDGYTELPKDSQRKKMSINIARSMGLGDDEVDVTKGMGTYGRFKLSFQPTDQDKVKHLEDTYGKENIRALEIGGKTKLLYRDEQETGNQFRAVDEEGTSLADFFGDTAGFVPELGGSVAGAIKGAGAGAVAGSAVPVFGTAVGTVVGGVLGAAAGGFAVGTAQDAAVRAASGEDIQLGEIAGRKAKEAAFGIVADVALLGTGRVASKFLRRSGMREAVGDGLADSIETVRRAGGQVTETSGMLAGGKTSARELEIAGLRPSSKVGKVVEADRDSLINLADGMSGKSTPVEAAARVAARARASRQSIENLVRESDDRAGKIINDAKLAGVRRFSTISDDMDRFGGEYKDLLTRLGQGADQISAEKYALRNRLAVELNVGVSKKDLLNAFDAGISKEPKFMNSAMKAARQKVADGEDFISFKDLDAELKLAANAFTEGARNSTSEQLAKLVAREIDQLRGTTAQGAGAEFNNAFLDASRFFKDDALGFRRGAVGKALKQSIGDFSATNQDVARAVFKDAETVREVLQTSSNADAFLRSPQGAGANPLRSASEMEKDMRRQFLSQLGFDKGTTSVAAAKLNKNQKEVLAQLWSGPNAQSITNKGRRKLAEYENLMKRVEQSGVKIPQLGSREIDDYLSAFSTRQRDDIRKELVTNARNREKLRIFEENSLIKKALKGEAGDHLRSKKFGDAIVNQATIGQAEDFMKLVDPGDIPFIRQNVIESLIARSGGEAAHGWDSTVMRKVLKRQEGPLKVILGKDYKLINSINDVMERRQPSFKTTTSGEVRPRTIIGQTGLSGYLSGDILKNLGNRFYGWAYATGVLKDLFVQGSQEASRKAWDGALIKMIGTSQGLQALSTATAEDPDARAIAIEQFGIGAEQP